MGGFRQAVAKPQIGVGYGVAVPYAPAAVTALTHWTCQQLTGGIVDHRVLEAPALESVGQVIHLMHPCQLWRLPKRARAMLRSARYITKPSRKAPAMPSAINNMGWRERNHCMYSSGGNLPT